MRAIAVIMVFGEHALGLKLGWAGVDLFFVLSGFLITRILRDASEQPDYWRRFYVKRITRIVPALALCLILSALVFHPGLHRLWWAYIFFAANFAMAYSRELPHGLGILWSLAVEEHFYLIWPLAVRFLSRRHLVLLLLSCITLEPLLRAAATSFLPFMTIYLLTPFRLDSLAAGSLLALAVERDATKAMVSRIAGPVCLCAAGAFLALRLYIPSFTRGWNTKLFNSVGYSLISLIATSFVAYVLLRERSAPSRILASSVAVRLGAISYGVYLFHRIALGLTARIPVVGRIPHISVLVAFLLVISFSSLSFRFYERPFLRWGHRLATQAPSAKHLL